MTLNERLVAAWARGLGLLPGTRSQQFAGRVAYLFSSDVVVAALGFAVNIWVIRALGPAGFGQVTLVFSVAQFLVIPLVGGLQTATTRYLASEPEGGGIITATIVLFVGLNLLFLPLFVLFRAELAESLRTSATVFGWAVLYAENLAFYYVVRGVLLGLRRFRKVAMSDVAGGVAFALAATVVLTRSPEAGFVGVVLANLLRWLVFALIGVFELVRKAGPTWRRWVAPLGAFAGASGVSTVAGFLFLGSIDNLMLNHYLGAGAVGLYGAYYAVFNVFTARFLRVVIEVLLPTAAAHESPRVLFAQIARAYARAGWVIIPLGWLLSVVLFAFYGRVYHYDWRLGLLMGVSVSLYGAIGVFNQLLIARGLRTMWLVTGCVFIAGAVNVAGNMILIPCCEIAGVMLASIVASVVALALQLLILTRFSGDTESRTSPGKRAAWPA